MTKHNTPRIKRRIQKGKKMKKTHIFIIAVTILLSSIRPSSTSGQAIVFRREQTLYLTQGPVTDPTNNNMFVPGGGAPSLWALVYEYFFNYHILSGEMVPWLAERYEYTDDYTKMKVYLRKGVAWSDGQPFTADDVVFTYQMEFNYTALSYSAAIRANIAEVRKIDNYTIEYTLKSRNPVFHLNGQVFPAGATYPCFTIMPKHIWQGKDPMTFKNNPPVGTGCYSLIYRDEMTTIYERRDDWWATKLFGIRPAPKNIVHRNLGTSESVASALASNDLDMTYMGQQLAMGLFKQVTQTNPHVRSYSRSTPMAFPSTWTDDVYINNEKYPWNLKEVRHALNYLINRDVIVSIATENTMATCYTPFGRLSVEASGFKPFWDKVKSIFAKYEINVYSPAKATAIFESLGFKKGTDGIWVTPNGTRLEAILRVGSEADPVEYVRPAQIIAQQLSEGGIAVRLEALTGVINSEKVNKGDFDFAVGAKTGVVPLPTFRLYEYHSKYWKPIGELASLNQWRFKNATFDAIVDEMEKTLPTDTAKLVSLFTQAMEIFCDQLPEIPTHSPDKLVQANTYYWTNFPFSDNPYAVFGSPHWPQFIWWVAGYISPTTGDWVGGLRPTQVDYAITYFTKATPKFRGIDLQWYGGFKKGDSANIPVDDAQFWIKQGYASFAPPSPEAEILPILTQYMTTLNSTISTMSQQMQAVQNVLSSTNDRLNLLSVAAVVEGIAIVVLVVAFVMVRRREEEA